MIKNLTRTELLKYACAYSVFSLLIAFFHQNIFSLLYFLCVGLVMFFVEPVLSDNASVNSKAYFSFLVSATFFSATYENFLNSTNQLNKVLCAAGTALLLAGLIAVTDKKKFNYCILIVPLLFFTEKRLCICLSAFFLSVFMLNFFITKKAGVGKSKKNKKDNQLQLSLVYILVSLVGLIAGIALYVTTSAKHSEPFSFFMKFVYKNLMTLIAIIYTLIKLATNEASFIRPVTVGFLIITGVSVFAGIYIGFIFLDISILLALFFLVYCCLQSKDTTESIRTDYEQNKLSFWIGAMLLLI